MHATDARDLLAYDAWAQRRLFDALGAVPDALYLEDLKSSHGGMHGTLCHIVSAGRVWLDRWLTRSVRAGLVPATVGGLAGLRREWEALVRERDEFAAGLTDATLDARFVMTTSKGERFEHRYADSVRHVVNHGSYHRGQIVAMLRQHGIAPPNTDLIGYYRTAR